MMRSSVPTSSHLREDPAPSSRLMWPSVTFVLLILVLFIPSPLVGRFDGGPLSGRFELLVAAVILPVLLVAGRSFLSLRWPAWLLGAALAGRLLFVVVPGQGLEVRIYETPDRWEQGACMFRHSQRIE